MIKKKYAITLNWGRRKGTRILSRPQYTNNGKNEIINYQNTSTFSTPVLRWAKLI